VGETPFYAESLVATYANIIDHKNKLEFPEEANVRLIHSEQIWQVSENARDLIRMFLSEATVRLGNHGTDEVKAHSFFWNDKWSFATLRNGKRIAVSKLLPVAEPPIIPDLKSDDDTRHFEPIEENQREPAESFQIPKAFAGNQLPFIGFTNTKELGYSVSP